MTYPLTPTQKEILDNRGFSLNFEGTPQTVHQLLHAISFELFRAGKIDDAWHCYQNDPMSCYGATFDAWKSSMQDAIAYHDSLPKSV